MRSMAALTSAGMRTPVSKAERHLGLVPVERDGAHRADRDVGHLHLGPVGQVADVAEDGGRRPLAGATRDRATG